MRPALILAFLVFVAGTAQALRISDFYEDAQVGQWILMKSSDGLLTRTSVIAKGDGKLTLRIQSFVKDRLVSDSEQLIDVSEGRVLSIRIDDGGNVKEIFPKETEVDRFFKIRFRPMGVDLAKVGRRIFHCRRYRGIYRDRVVRVWISEEVPILHLAKMTMQGVAVRLVDFGSGKVKSG